MQTLRRSTLSRRARSGAAVLALGGAFVATPALAQITFYQGEGFRGRAVEADQPIPDLGKLSFNDRASSAVVTRGHWEVCEDARFRGRCVVLRRGSYESLRGMGLENRISSVRPVDDRRHYEHEAPEPVMDEPNYAYRRRPEERVHEAQVTSVHAVVGPPEQHCWVSREEVREYRPNVGGAIAGAVIGGIIGHQIGGGGGRDAATVGGAAVGGAIGANAGRNDAVGERDVRRCETAPPGPPEYWDVTYDFRGYTHRIQMTAPPGPTIVVNDDGEPRQ